MSFLRFLPLPGIRSNDEANARREAMRRHLRFIDTLGILRSTAQLDLLDLPPTPARLLETTSMSIRG